MRSTVRSFGILAASAAAGFAATLLCAWPAPIHAQGNGAALHEQAGLAAGTSKIGPLVAASRVITLGGRCFVETRVRNSSGQRVDEAPIEADLYRTVSSPMARVMPMPTKVWQATHQVSVDPGAEIALRDSLGSELCAQITARPTSAPKDNSAALAMQPVTSFHTAVVGAQRPTDTRRDAPQRVVVNPEMVAPRDAPLATEQRAQGERSWATPPPQRAESVAQRQAAAHGQQRPSAAALRSSRRGGRNRI